MQRRALVLGAALAATPGVQAAAAAPALCERGRRQSPIDITATVPRALPALRLQYRAGPARLAHDGHTVRVRTPAGSTAQLGAERLVLQQFHFHLPGGDRLKGEAFPVALHFLHRGAGGRLVALVQWFRLGPEHAALAALLPQMPGAGAAPVAVPALEPAAWLLPAGGYFAYDGSLTAPPCTEGVRWLVMKAVATLSAAQWARLQQIVPLNAREPQPLHGREVQESA